MRVYNACAWVEERIRARRPCFAVRINDGEMVQMFKTRPEGELLGTSENPTRCHWELGNALRSVIHDTLARDNVMIGHCCHDDPGNELNKRFWGELSDPWLISAAEAGGHWPLDGACDGSMRRLIEAAAEMPNRAPTCLVTSVKLAAAGALFDRTFLVDGDDSWRCRHEVHHSLVLLAVQGMTFFWAAGAGLKPTAWRLWREHPQSTHVDVGHVFNGALGLRDYGWLQRQDEWWDRYFAPGGFADWVQQETGASDVASK